MRDCVCDTPRRLCVGYPEGLCVGPHACCVWDTPCLLWTPRACVYEGLCRASMRGFVSGLVCQPLCASPLRVSPCVSSLL